MFKTLALFSAIVFAHRGLGDEFKSCESFHDWHLSLCLSLTAVSKEIPCTALAEDKEASELCWGMASYHDPEAAKIPRPTEAFTVGRKIAQHSYVDEEVSKVLNTPHSCMDPSERPRFAAPDQVAAIVYVDQAIWGAYEKVEFEDLLQANGMMAAHETKLEKFADILEVGALRIGNELPELALGYDGPLKVHANTYFQLFPVDLTLEKFQQGIKSGWVFMVLNASFFSEVRPRFHVNDSWDWGKYTPGKSGIPESSIRLKGMLQRIKDNIVKKLKEVPPWDAAKSEVVVNQGVPLKYFESIHVSQAGYEELLKIAGEEKLRDLPIKVWKDLKH